MKKWLTACLLAIALLFVATTAMAGHNKANGEYCLGGSYALLKEYENQHLLRCNDCQEEILENHWIGQEATCIRKAQCGGCTARFGDYGPHDWGEWKSNGNGAHTRVCKHNASHTETKDCTFSAAPCTVPAACTECGAVYKLGHDWGAWTSNGNKTHTHTCKRDASHIETENCNIQEATCRDPAWCWECYGEYGSADPSKHNWTFCRSNGNGTHTRMCSWDFTHTETSDCSGVRCGETGWCDECHERYTASHKFNGPWLSNPDKHWRACIYCNEAGSKASHSFVEQPDARYLKSEATCASPAVYYRVCSDCGYQTPSTFESGDIDPNNHDLQRHEEVKAPTCTEKGWSAYYTCSRCDYTAYQETDALDHDWNDWTSNGNKTHTRTCKRDSSHTETEACSGVSCGDTGACSVCGGAYTSEHKYDESSWSCDDAEHWRNCVYCHEKGEIASHSFEMHEQTAATCVSKAVYAKVCSDCNYQGGNFIFGNINPDNHDLIPHAGKAPTCTEKGWKDYNTCSRCDYSTYEELPALGHDPIPHAGKAATCTESGWEAYDTCSRCNYTTYAKLTALGHDPIPHAAQAPTCTEPGWEAYDTCSRCNYTTYAELAALNHDWSIWVSNGDKTHTRTCKNDPSHIQKASCSGVSCGETGACAVCGGEYTVAHEYINTWTSDGADKHWRVCLLCGAGKETASHSFSEYPDAKATCVSPAKYLKICLYCFYREIIWRGDIDPNNHNLAHHEAQAPTCTEIGWEAYDTCSRCTYTTYAELPAEGHDPIPHAAQAPTCTEVGWEAYDTCSRCDYSTYVELPAEGHDPIPHAGKAATCTETGWNAYETCKRDGCNYTTYKEIPALEHEIVKHDAKAPTCTDIGWNAYETCKRDGCNYTTYKEIPALEHEIVKHDAKAPTCTETGWNAYETCKRDGCNYTTYKEIPALEHEIVKHDAKAPTCTEIGWNAYETCKREGCDYTTKVEIPALNHDLVRHDAKAPTCTEVGWEAYDTCSRCDYTTYQEIPALGHDYAEQVVKPTCKEGGYTLHTCKNCKDSYKDHQTEKLLHWYGEWTNNGDGTNSVTCKREDCKHVGKTECAIVEFKQIEATLTLCPVCGNVSDGTHLALVEEVTAEGEHLPQGELVLRMGEISNGNTLLSVCFEYSGKLTQPKGEVKITLPAELLNGVTLTLLNADDTEIDLPYIVEGENAAFTLDFTDAALPTALIRLIPTAE